MKNTSKLSKGRESLKAELLNYGFTSTKSKKFLDVIYARTNMGKFKNSDIYIEFRRGSDQYLVFGEICKTENDVAFCLMRLESVNKQATH